VAQGEGPKLKPQYSKKKKKKEKKEKEKECQAWWCTPVIIAFGQADTGGFELVTNLHT
jgi:hypothetical protein